MDQYAGAPHEIRKDRAIDAMRASMRPDEAHARYRRRMRDMIARLRRQSEEEAKAGLQQFNDQLDAIGKWGRCRSIRPRRTESTVVHEAAGTTRRLFSLCQFGDQLSLRGEIRKSLFERSDGVPKIVAARCQRPGEHRIGGIGAIGYPGTIFLGGNVAIEDPDDAIEVANHCGDSRHFP
jgi:hypothetical protein